MLSSSSSFSSSSSNKNTDELFLSSVFLNTDELFFSSVFLLLLLQQETFRKQVQKFAGVKDFSQDFDGSPTVGETTMPHESSDKYLWKLKTVIFNIFTIGRLSQ